MDMRGSKRCCAAALVFAVLLTACGEDRAATPPTAEGPVAPVTAARTDITAPLASETGGQAAAPLPEIAPDFPQQASDVAVDPAVRYGVLGNGMRYALLLNDTPTDSAALRLRVNVGSLDETEEERGLAHFIEHMAFNGTTNIPEDELVAMLERYGLAFGPDTNAYTSFSETVYQLNLPSTDDETMDVALFILREMAGEALFDPAAVERERGVVLAEQRVRNTVGLRYLEARNRFLFPDATLSKRLPIGLVEVLETAPAARMRAFYQRHYIPSETFLVAVGDFDLAALEAKIIQAFGGWPAADTPAPPTNLGAVRRRETEAGFFTDPDIYTIVGIYAVKPPTNPADTIAQRRQAFLRFLGEAIVDRRLQRLSRDPDARFLQGDAGFDTVFDTNTADFASLEMIAKPEDWRDALALGEQELRRALIHGFTQAELAEQLANVRTFLENAADQADTRDSFGLADAITASFARAEVFTHPNEDLAQFEALLPDITPERVHDAFRAGWADVEPLLFVSSNMPLASAETEILKVFRNSQAQAVSPPVDTSAVEFAYTRFGEPGRVERQRRDDSPVIGPVDLVEFENGVRLNIKPTPFEDDVVRVSVRVGGGLLEFPKGLEGLHFLYNNAFTDGGLEAHSVDELQSVLAGRAINLGGASAGSDAFVFRAATTPEDLLLQLQVFAAYLTAPGFRVEGEAQYRQLFNIVYDTFDSQPSSVRQRDVPRLLRSGDPRFGIPAKDALMARSFDELRLVTARAFGEGAVEIAIVGDIEPDAVIDAVADTFGALAPRHATPERFEDARQVRFPDGPRRITLTHAGEPNQAEVNVYWPTVDDSDVGEVRRLNLLQRVFDLKLIERLREQDGETYSASAGSFTSQVSPGYGYLSVSLAVEPERVDVVFAAIDAIAAELTEGGISPDELDRARSPLLEQIEQSLEDNGYWLNLLSRAQTSPRYMAQAQGRGEAYAAITLADLADAAATYLQADSVIRIAIVPEAP